MGFAKIKSYLKWISVYALFLLLFGCYSEIDQTPTNEPHQNDSSYQLTEMHDSDIAVIASDYEVMVNLSPSINTLRVGNYAINPDTSNTAGQVRLHFLKEAESKSFDVSYSDSCNHLTPMTTCQISLLPNNQAHNLDGRSVFYFISANISGKVTKLKPESFVVKSLSTSNQEILGSGSKSKIIVTNQTGTSVDVTNYSFSSEDQNLIFSHNTCDITLDNNQSCSVEMQVGNNTKFERTHYKMTNNKNNIDAVVSNLNVIRPIVRLSKTSLKLKPFETKTIYVINQSPIPARNLVIDLPELAHVTMINHCGENTNLSGLTGCSIEFDAGENPSGEEALKISGDNFNSPNNALIQTETPTNFNLTLLPNHITTNSNIAKEVIIKVSNDGDFDIDHLSLNIETEASLFTINDKSTCNSNSVLKPKDACQYILDYHPGEIINPSYLDVLINVTGNDSSTQSALLTVNNYPKFYSIPQNTTRFHDSISSNFIRSVFVAPNGSVYIGSDQSGLSVSKNKLKNWLDITNADKLTNNTVTSLFVDNKNILYAGTLNGLTIFDDQGQFLQSLTILDGLASNHIQSVTVDQTGLIYIGTTEGLSIFDANDHLIINLTVSDGLDSNNVQSIAVNPNGFIYAGTVDGLSIFDMNYHLIKTLKQSDGLTHPNIQSIALDAKGNIYAGTLGGGVAIFDEKYHLIETLNKADGLISNLVQAVIIDSNGQIYAGTDQGISIFNSSYNLVQNLDISNGLGNCDIKSVFIDQQGNLLVGTFGGGLSVFDSNLNWQQTIISNDNLNNYHIRSVFYGENNHLYEAASPHGGILVFDSEYRHLKTITKDDGLVGDPIRSIFVDKKGTIYAGTYGSVSILDDQYQFVKLLTTSNGLSNNNVWSVFLDKNDTLYVGNYGGLSIFDNTLNYTNHLLSFNSIGSVFVDQNGLIYAGDRERYGVSIFDQDLNNIKILNTKNGVINQNVTSLFVDHEGNIYIGTLGGVSVFDRQYQHLINLTKENGLISNQVYSLFVDSLGRIYVGTDEGLSIYDQHYELLDTITTDDGIGNNWINSIFVNSKGAIYIGTDSGVAVMTIS